jgi:hypothetical protein
MGVRDDDVWKRLHISNSVCQPTTSQQMK